MSKLILFYSDGREIHQAIGSWLGKRARIVNEVINLHMELSENEYQTLILDAEYEKSSGYAIAEDVKRIYENAPKIVILSNEMAIGRPEKLRYAGADVLLSLPFNAQELEAVL